MGSCHATSSKRLVVTSGNWFSSVFVNNIKPWDCQPKSLQIDATATASPVFFSCIQFSFSLFFWSSQLNLWTLIDSMDSIRIILGKVKTSPAPTNHQWIFYIHDTVIHQLMLHQNLKVQLKHDGQTFSLKNCTFSLGDLHSLFPPNFRAIGFVVLE